MLVDEQMGELLNKLKVDGLIEDTFVFALVTMVAFFLAARATSSQRTPSSFAFRKISESFVDQAATRTDGFVSFIDFGPTVLNQRACPFPNGRVRFPRQHCE